MPPQSSRSGHSNVESDVDAVSRIRLLGDPILHCPCREVNPRDEHVSRVREELHSLLGAFRRVCGFGRAIAAPQGGRSLRLIAAVLKSGPVSLHNPTIFWRSAETVTMWDDCFSFPSMMVRLRRHASISVRFEDDVGGTVEWEHLPLDVSELLQHEIDHLDGIVSFDRMFEERDRCGPQKGRSCVWVVHRQAYLQNQKEYDAMVDYAIPVLPVPNASKL